MPTLTKWSSLSEREKELALSRPALKDNIQLQETVKDIIAQVRKSGDNALKHFCEKFDGVSLGSLRLPKEIIESSISGLSSDVCEAIDLAYENIRLFHQAQYPKDIEIETTPGVICQQKHSPIARVGLYVPGGTAPLPSTVLMLGVSAQVAGCELAILCTPPNKQGTVAPEILYAAKKCGIQEIYLCGGAQAIAAMAFGTNTIPKVDKIFGPGNSFVTEAKQQVSQTFDGAAIDMPAGPSEVLVLADKDANPAFVASDLLSQAEHGADSQAILVSDNETLITRTITELENQLNKLPRKDIAAASIANSRFILCEDINKCIEVTNTYAAEHLIVQTEDASILVDKLANAGSIFVGPWSPESAGDYASGTNHVLPTYGYSRTYSSLGLLDFMRRYTVQTLSKKGIRSIGPAIMTLASAEGLDAHKQAVALRLDTLDKMEGGE
ncbi:histidinol dehydrogenase [Agaribacter marinus]|uniref:Histidinol dehydrogenase n=1 Tax=Agaribacter marinus TaxID=1431249 RepID=A0AA37T130_9ALTE|nr:histidinol dehydrogenase [Agaribacter marinus]GLR72009.1 histidinol dehydrogenase [Agaribacter marinus]